MSAPQIFDPALARARLERALRLNVPSADFLLRRATEDFVDRLALVKREFSVAVDIATAGSHGADALRRDPRVGFVARAAPAMVGLASNSGATFVGEAERLALAPQSCDLIVSLLALQSVNDLPGALIQFRQALKPDGLFLACLLGGDTLTELRQSLTAGEAEILAGAAPRVAPFADVRALGALLQRAGLALPVVDLDRVVVRYESIVALMRDLRAMGATNVLVARSRRFLRRDVLARSGQIYGERFADADGRLRATFDMVWLSGWAPHESQQKPLRPGSAKARLEDAVKGSRGG
jgi:SAM-dependent methyltransferase